MKREEVSKMRGGEEWEKQMAEKEKMEWVRKSWNGDGETWCGNSHLIVFYPVLAFL